jgi:hypothetical protein
VGIISLQGPRGSNTYRGRQVIDFYEIYSVHQHGMASAFLIVRWRTACRGRERRWSKVFCGAERMFYRSQVRAGELRPARPRVRRSLVNAALCPSDAVGDHRGFVLRKECRSMSSAGFCGRSARIRITPN